MGEGVGSDGYDPNYCGGGNAVEGYDVCCGDGN